MYGKPYKISIVSKYHVIIITLTELKRRALLFWVISRLLQFEKWIVISEEIVVDVIKNVRKEIDSAQWSDNLIVYIKKKKKKISFQVKHGNQHLRNQLREQVFCIFFVLFNFLGFIIGSQRRLTHILIELADQSSRNTLVIFSPAIYNMDSATK